MAVADPILSIVVTSRNDDHGINLLGRMQAFVNNLIGQCKRHNLPSELIIVEWNPQPDRPKLAQALKWPPSTGPCQVRIIEVPPELHYRFRHSHALPLFQMIAKNVGIRRARGKFVLCTNIDILMNDELMRFFASDQMKPGHMYRIDRHDVMADVPVFGTVDEQLEYCETHHLRVNAREGTFPLTADGKMYPAQGLITTPGVRLVKGWSPIQMEGRPRKERGKLEVRLEQFTWAGNQAVIEVDGPADPNKTLKLVIGPGPGVDMLPFELFVHDADEQLVAMGKVKWRQEVHLALPWQPGQRQEFKLSAKAGGEAAIGDTSSMCFRVFNFGWSDHGQRIKSMGQSSRAFNMLNLYAPDGSSMAYSVARWAYRRMRWGYRRVARTVSGLPILGKLMRRKMAPAFIHTNACGDFTLMARDHWFDLRANPEFEMYSFHIDSVMCYMGHHGGAPSTELKAPMKCYHIEHSIGSGATPEGMGKLLERLAAKGIPVLEYQQVLDWASQMRQENKPIIFNEENWGLADYQLPETVIGAMAKAA